MTSFHSDRTFDLLPDYRKYSTAEMFARSRAFAAEMQRRRTTRHFSDRPVPRAVIDACLEAAEEAEREFYAPAPAEWLAALAPLGTDANKPYLETAPYLIAVFAERYGITPSGTRRAHYYVNESVGIATGFLLAALHHAGLVALTHTPNPMGFSPGCSSARPTSVPSCSS